MVGGYNYIHVSAGKDLLLVQRPRWLKTLAPFTSQGTPAGCCTQLLQVGKVGQGYRFRACIELLLHVLFCCHYITTSQAVWGTGMCTRTHKQGGKLCSKGAPYQHLDVHSYFYATCQFPVIF